ncbi:MAG: helix-turn-helix domain-containing protein [Alphaproteobacteria bacterium]|nr:helix-turn-helix domain-containing protein [Alphaproteobacteria bacterium]
MLSEALRLLRVFHDMKQIELADQIGLSKSYISEIENGNRTPSLDVIQKYAEIFKIPVSSIMFFSEQMEAKNGTKTRLVDVRNAIATKILNFLKVIEDRTSAHEES